MKLLIATPYYEIKGFATYIRSIVASASNLTRSGIDFGYYDVCGDAYVDRAKNTIANYFLESDFTDLLMIDSDMSWNMEGLVSVLKSPHEIIAGTYIARNGTNFCGAVMKKDDKYLTDSIGNLYAFWIPGGFVRFKKSVFQKMVKSYPDDWYIDETANTYNDPNRKYYKFFWKDTINHRLVTEDCWFCQRWNAIGGKILIDPNIYLGHSWSTEHVSNIKKMALENAQYEVMIENLQKAEPVKISKKERKELARKIRCEINRINKNE